MDGEYFPNVAGEARLPEVNAAIERKIGIKAVAGAFLGIGVDLFELGVEAVKCRTFHDFKNLLGPLDYR